MTKSTSPPKGRSKIKEIEAVAVVSRMNPKLDVLQIYNVKDEIVLNSDERKIRVRIIPL